MIRAVSNIAIPPTSHGPYSSILAPIHSIMMGPPAPDPLYSLSSLHELGYQGLLTLSESFDDERKVDEGGKHHVELVKAGEDSSEAFESPK